VRSRFKPPSFIYRYRALVVASIAVISFLPPVVGSVKHFLEGDPPAPGEFDRQIEQARRLLDAKQAVASLAYLERAEEINLQAFAVHNNFCVAYGLLERRDQAVASCRRAVELDPSSTLAKNNLAWVSRGK
jgi:tetratricopeptide (TPR) repeat protein